MMNKRIKGLLIIAAVICFQNWSSAQAITIEDALKAWDNMSKMVIESAKIMPAENYSYTPGEPLRNFANQINHTAGSNIGFGYAVNAGKPDFAIPDRNKPPQSKEEVLAFLEKSFAYFRDALSKLTTDNLNDEVMWGRQGSQRSITRLKAILIITSHLQSEHGKTMMYLRGKGIQPPPSSSWAF
jgi:hypothetical protein